MEVALADRRPFKHHPGRQVRIPSQTATAPGSPRALRSGPPGIAPDCRGAHLQDPSIVPEVPWTPSELLP